MKIAEYLVCMANDTIIMKLDISTVFNDHTCRFVYSLCFNIEMVPTISSYITTEKLLVITDNSQRIMARRGNSDKIKIGLFNELSKA